MRRYQRPIQRRRYTRLGSNAQAAAVEQTLPAIGSAIGGPIGSAVGSALSAVASIFGGKEHTTSSGVTYKNMQSTLKSTYAEYQTIMAQYASLMGSSYTAVPWPDCHTQGEATCPQLCNFFASLLNNPSLANGTYNTWKSIYSDTGGLGTQAIETMQAQIQQMQAALAGAQSAIGGAIATNGITNASDPTGEIGSSGTLESPFSDVGNLFPSLSTDTGLSPDITGLFLIGAAGVGLYLLMRKQ